MLTVFVVRCGTRQPACHHIYRVRLETVVVVVVVAAVAVVVAIWLFLKC